MQLEVLQEDLAQALDVAIHFVSTRSTLPILSNFFLIAQKTKLTIQSTNLEMSVSTSIGAKIKTEGQITLPAKTFYEIVTSLPKGQITLNINNEKLHIETTSFQSDLETFPANDFPQVPSTLNQKASFILNSSALSKALSKILFSVSLDEARPVLTGVLFNFADSLELVASDGFRLSRKTVKLPTTLKAKNIIVPRAALLELIKLSKNFDTIAFELKENDNQLILQIGETLITSRLIEGNFPDYEKIIPPTSPISVNIDKNDLTRSVKLASVFAREASSIVKFILLDDSLELASENGKKGSQTSKIDAKIDGGALEILFNYKFVEEFLSIAEGESVEIKLVDSSSAAIFIDSKDTGFLHLIMPVKVQN
jgi:DNA polymerase III subunit beta